MKRMAFAFTIAALLCSTIGAEEARTRNKRKDYGDAKATVQDPATFKVAGEPTFSGPQPSEKVTTFKATSLIGADKGKEIDPIAAGKDGPMFIVFQDESGVAIRGLFGLAQAVGQIERKSEKNIHFACVFLSDDDTKINQFKDLFPKLVERGIDSLSISTDGREGPGTFGLNRTVSQTIILARNGKVTRNFVFPQGLLYADPHVIGAVAELIGEERETVAEWLAENKSKDRMRMRGGDRGQDAAKAAFREKLGEFVKAGKINREEAGELYRTAFPAGE